MRLKDEQEMWYRMRRSSLVEKMKDVVLSVIKGQVLHLLCRVDYTRVLDLNNCYFDISG